MENTTTVRMSMTVNVKDVSNKSSCVGFVGQGTWFDGIVLLNSLHIEINIQGIQKKRTQLAGISSFMMYLHQKKTTLMAWVLLVMRFGT